MTIYAAEKVTIDTVLINDEGGWVLNHLDNDNDGGWTYAGVTCTIYMSFVYPGRARSYQEMEAIIQSPLLDKVKDNVYDIYYAYMQTAARILSLSEVEDVFDYELSTIILCGAGGFKDIINISGLEPNSVGDSDKAIFLDAWKQYLQSLHSPYEAGWMNRVSHYE